MPHELIPPGARRALPRCPSFPLWALRALWVQLQPPAQGKWIRGLCRNFLPHTQPPPPPSLTRSFLLPGTFAPHVTGLTRLDPRAHNAEVSSAELRRALAPASSFREAGPVCRPARAWKQRQRGPAGGARAQGRAPAGPPKDPHSASSISSQQRQQEDCCQSRRPGQRPSDFDLQHVDNH